VTGRVVFDVNILVSAILSPTGAPARAVSGALEQEWEILRSSEIIIKLIQVTGRPHISARIGSRLRNAFVGEFQGYAESVIPDPTIVGFADDAEDDAILGTAVAGNADIIVTGDKGLLALHPFRGIAILTAREFLSVVDPGRLGDR
jgi:putative PIN family toxin of toxin-antitoxin system